MGYGNLYEVIKVELITKNEIRDFLSKKIIDMSLTTHMCVPLHTPTEPHTLLKRE